ncbi:hypothetical protein Lfu02_77530 [Longispora fulva]|nr:hypothetical protein Lfu02_77530 [Longispora fulva]
MWAQLGEKLTETKASDADGVTRRRAPAGTAWQAVPSALSLSGHVVVVEICHQGVRLLTGFDAVTGPALGGLLGAPDRCVAQGTGDLRAETFRLWRRGPVILNLLAAHRVVLDCRVSRVARAGTAGIARCWSWGG